MIFLLTFKLLILGIYLIPKDSIRYISFLSNLFEQINAFGKFKNYISKLSPFYLT